METKLKQLKDYFKTNPGTPFILAFMILLLSAAALLITGRPNEADNVANYRDPSRSRHTGEQETSSLQRQ